MPSIQWADTPVAMIRDLRNILDGWPYEPGRISCRRIIGHDGREKLQTRIDLGMIQLECTGRPDGQRPSGHESLLELQEQRLREHIAVHGNDQDFVLTPEACRNLRHEAHLYYQRYLAEFVLEDFAGVARDTRRNLRVMEICERYAAAAQDRNLLRPQRAYVIMMHTRARAQLALAVGKPEAALSEVRQGILDICAHEELPEGSGDDSGASTGDADSGRASELEALQTLQAEILASLPDSSPAKLQARLEAALAAEDYEEAARLRDQLRNPVASSSSDVPTNPGLLPPPQSVIPTPDRAEESD